MKTFLFVLILATSLNSYAQKVKLEENVYYVDGQPYMYSTFKYKKDEVANFTSPDQKIVYFKAITFIETRSNYGSNVTIRYAKLYFNDEKNFLFTQYSTVGIVKAIYKCNCMTKDGKFDIDKLLASSKAFKESPPQY